MSLCVLGWPGASWAQAPSRVQGVTAVRYGKGAVAEASWAVGPPLLTLGDKAADGPELFWNVAGVMPIGDEHLVVGDGGSSEIRFFNRVTGDHVRTVGGEGRGPGEIDRLWNMWRAGDYIVAVDAAGRASYFEAMGNFLRRVPPPVSNLGRRLRRAGFFSDGSTLAFGVESEPVVPPDGRKLVSMRLVRLTGDEPSMLMRHPHHIVTRKGTARPWGLVFGARAVLATTGDHFCVGFPREYVIDCFSHDARPLYRIVRESWRRVSVTDRHREDYFAVNEAANPGPRGAPYIRYLRENAQFAEEFPAFGRFVTAATGDLWVGPFVPEGDTPVLKPSPAGETRWSVYAPDGRWVADVVLPARFRLMSVAEDYVAGVARDEHDVERVVVLPLRKR